MRPHRCVVAGGGSVGLLFARHLASSGYHVCVVDREPLGDPGGCWDRFQQADITDIQPYLADEVSRAQLVVLAVPAQVALAALSGIAATMASDALLVDTLSAKQHIVAAARAIPPDLQMISLNPMFAPSLGIAGRPVAAVVVHDGPRARDLLRLVGTWGGRVVPMTAEAHDRVAAAAQGLTHAAVLAFGLALAELGVTAEELSAIAPPPHASMLALLSRICGGTPEVYWDVQSANPHASQARAALRNGAARLAALTDSGNQAGFVAELSRLRSFLGPEIGHYRDVCARMFAAAGEAPGRSFSYGPCEPSSPPMVGNS